MKSTWFRSLITQRPFRTVIHEVIRANEGFPITLDERQPRRFEKRPAPSTSLKVPKAFRPTSERKVGVLSMPAFLRFYPVFCSVFDFAAISGVLRFFVAEITRPTAGLWDNGLLARFLCFFVSLPVRVKSRPTLPDGPDTEKIDSANRWIFDRFSIEGVAASPFAEISPQRIREKPGNDKWSLCSHAPPTLPPRPRRFSWRLSGGSHRRIASPRCAIFRRVCVAWLSTQFAGSILN